jgi:hypothetical protein
MSAATTPRWRGVRRQMIASTLGLKLLLSLAFAAVGLTAGATASFGDGRVAGNSSVFIGTFEDHQTFSDAVPGDYPCFDGVSGTVTGTDDVFGRYNNAPDFFHATGTFTTNYRIDFSDGRYVLGRYVEHFGTQANAESGVNRSSDTHTSQEQATVYSADGQAIGKVTIHATFHIRVTDFNGNYQPDPGEVTSSVDRFRVTCS